MNLWVTINFASRCLKNFCFYSFRETKHIDRTVHISFCGLNWITLIMNRGRRAGKIIDFIHLHVQWKSNIMPNQFEVRLPNKVSNIITRTAIKIVDAQNITTVI